MTAAPTGSPAPWYDTGIAQWYENTLYISSLGQGISAKVFDERDEQGKQEGKLNAPSSKTMRTPAHTRP